MDTQRTSVLPRPLSKLPMPRSFQTAIPQPTSPEPAPPPNSTIARHHVTKLSSGSTSTTSSHHSSSSIASLSSSRPPTGHKTSYESSGVRAVRSRPPLHSPQLPQSNQGPSGPEQQLARAQTYSKASRHISQQENALELWDSPEESDGSSNKTTSPLRTIKRPPRPSLADRTVDSLTHMSPAVNKRRSSFFNPDSPMATPVRPTSVTSQSAVPKLSYGSLRREPGFARPVSPTKRVEARVGIPSTPSAHRRTNTALPRTGLSNTSAAGTPSTQMRGKSAIKLPGRPSSAVGMNTSPPKTLAASKTPGPGSRFSMIAPKSTLQSLTTPQPVTQLRKPQQGAALARPKRPTSIAGPPRALGTAISSLNPPANNSPSSSTGLRAQIAQARAAARKNAATANSQTRAAKSSSYSFVNSDDPFNQGLQNEQSLLVKRIDAARRDGRLNIAALSLKQIPDEVLHMYDSEAMEASSVAWNETVDLVRFSAADNEMAEVSDQAFPDLSIEELAQGVDARGNQFGGIEALDLHGNVLMKIPTGLRRLGRLTTLNLARNKLDNGIFEVVVQIPSLRELFLGGNELSREVPESINQLVNLEVLDMQNNKLSDLPKTIRDFLKLRVLNLSENRFAELPLGSLFSLPNLSEIYVAGNALTGAFFPNTVDIIRSLKTLDVSNNSLAALTFASDLHLPALEYVNVARNRLFSFPDITSWSGLVNLLAEENGLTTLPAGFCSLKKLRTADFSGNSLRAIEADIGKMDALETLNVAANPLREKRFLSMSTNEIKDELVKRLESSGP